MAVEQGRVGAVAQQQRADLHAVFRRRLMEGGELPKVHGVHTRSVLEGGGGVKVDEERAKNGENQFL